MAEHKLIYNPKKYNGIINTAKVVDMFAAREDGKPEGKLLERPAVYDIAPNELKKFRIDIANYLLGKFEFLQEVNPRNVDETLKEMKEKLYRCQLCDFETDTQIALKGHMRSHKLSEEAKKVLAEIPEAKPSAYVRGTRETGTGMIEFVQIEQQEGIPRTSSGDPRAKGPVDREGVEWYGEGLETQRRAQKPATRQRSQI